MSERPGDEGPWFRRWFGEEYLRVYPHRDKREARRAVELLLHRLENAGVDLPQTPPTGPPDVLDLACGAGRHLGALAELKVSAVGLDLSEHLLQEARATLTTPRLLRGDMRHLPFADATFTVVTSFFTSFGYFETEREDRGVLREIRRVVKPGGHVLLDFLNAAQVRAGLRPHDVHTIGDREVVQQRRLLEDGRRVEKQIRITGPGSGPPQRFTERVRLYESDELTRLLASEGLKPLELFGDYGGGSHGPETPRAIVFARAV
ncbi:MAG: class I SAM-dependent methyltransferase [Gemmatimonadales bacterium]|nr:MAG: class I SAM-dependent methyltransferase [Gemmatimonadales bacterium]